MHTAILTLQYPKGLKGLPIATTSNIAALRFFKLIALKDWEGGNEEASGECEAISIPSKTTDSRVNLTGSFPRVKLARRGKAQCQRREVNRIKNVR